MLGDASLGEIALGEMDVAAATTPIPADARVWFTVATEASVVISADDVNMDFGGG